MRKHKYKIMLMTTIILGFIHIPMYIIAFTDSSMFAFILQRIAMIMTLSFIVLIIYMGRHKELMRAEFNNTAEITLSYMERRKLETPEVFKNSLSAEHICAESGVKSIDADEYNIPLKYLHRLFIVDSDSANYTTFTALDIRDGKPYILIKRKTNLKSFYGADFHTRPIDYDEVRKYAARVRKEADYAELDASSWESFIPEDKRYVPEEKTDNRVDISAASASRDGSLSTFFYERRVERMLHEIAYLRKTDKGVRLFGARALDGVIGLRFEFDFTEQMVSDAIDGKYGKMLYAADRPVSERELAFIYSTAAAKTDEPPKSAASYVCYSVADGKVDDEITAQKQNLGQVLLEMALYGTK